MLYSLAARLTQPRTLVLIAASLIFALFTWIATDGLLKAEQQQIARVTIRTLAARLDQDALEMRHVYSEAEQSVRFFAQTPPISGIGRALAGEGQDPSEQSTLGQWQARLQQIGMAYVANHPDIFQLRLIGIADRGRELVRVVQDLDGEVTVVGVAGLQQKGDRPYFTEALGTPEGSVYFSPIELNVEYGQIEQPPRPTLRAAMPLRDAGGKVFCVVVVNQRAQGLLDALAKPASPGDRVWVTDAGGHFLAHPEPGQAFAHELNPPGDTWQDSMTAVNDEAALSGHQDPTTATWQAPDGTRWLVVTRTLLPVDPSHAGGLVVHRGFPLSVLTAQAWQAARSGLALAWIMGLLVIGLLVVPHLVKESSSPVATDSAGQTTEARYASAPPRWRVLAAALLPLVWWGVITATLQTGLSFPFVTMLLPVLVASWWGGYRAGVIATGLAVLGALDLASPASHWGNLAEVPPASWLAATILALSGVAVTTMQESLRRQAAEQVALEQQRSREREAATEHLEASESKFRGLWESSRDAKLILFPPDWRLSNPNRASVELFGAKDGAQLSSLSWIDLSPEYQPDGQPSATAAAYWLEKALSEGVAFFEWTHRVDGREFPCEVTLARITQDGISGVQATTRNISERTRAAAELERLRLLMTAGERMAKIGSWEYNAATQRTIWSEGECRIFGIEPGTSPDYNAMLQRYIHPDDAGRLDQAFRAAFERKEKFEMEHRIVRPDGSMRVVLDIGFPDLNAEGEIVRYTGATLDVTDHRALEQELKTVNASLERKVEERTQALTAAQAQLQAALAQVSQSEHRFRTMIEEAPLGIALIDSVTGQIQEANERYAQITGRTVQELMGVDWRQITHPDDIQEDVDNMTRLNAGEISSYQVDKRYFRPDGSRVWVNKTVAAIDIGTGEGHRHLSMIDDISDQIAARQQVEEASRLLRVAIGAAEIGIWYWDLATNRLQWDERMHAWYETPDAVHASGLLYDFWKQRVHPDDRERAASSLQAAIQNNTPWDCVFRLSLSDDRVRYIQAAAIMELGADGQPSRVVGVNRDITPQYEQEAALRQAKHAADNANLAKSQFLASMSHEIRTPMNAVLGLAQLLEDEPLSTEQNQMVHRIRQAGRSLLGIINDILDFSKIEAGQLSVDPQPFNLKELLGRIDSLMGYAAHEKGLFLQLEDVTPPGVWVGDVHRIEQVLINLIGNAVKFTERGGVTLRVLPVTATDSRACLRFETEDTGIGMSPDVTAKLFTPFTQADSGIARRFGGTGLGLSISKRLVELMGGSLGVESTLGEGSLFWFELPLDQSPVGVEASPQKAPAMAGPRLPGLRLLVVDDSEMNRDLIARALKKEGAVAVLASDGQQGIDELQQQPQAFDAVLMDIQMPVMDGLSATRIIRYQLGLTQLPVIAFTAGVLAEEVKAAHDAGINGFLAKPVDLDQMVGLLLQWCPLAVERYKSVGLAPAPVVPPPPLAHDAFPRIAGLDTHEAAQRLGNDRDFFLELLAQFADEFAEAAHETRQAIREGDRASAKARLHSLRGTVGTLGGSQLMATAQELETAVASEINEAALEPLLACLTEQLAALIVAIRSTLAEETPPLTPAPQGDPVALDQDKLEALIDALSHSALSGLELFAELRPALETLAGPDAVTAMAADVKALRFNAALAQLNQWLAAQPPN